MRTHADELLRLIRLTIKQMSVDEDPFVRQSHGDEVAAYFTSLDEWLLKDGVLPAEWMSEDEKNKPGWVDRVLSNVNEWSDEEFGMAFGFTREDHSIDKETN